jgi:hypothetical protein
MLLCVGVVNAATGTAVGCRGSRQRAPLDVFCRFDAREHLQFCVTPPFSFGALTFSVICECQSGVGKFHSKDVNVLYDILLPRF